MERKSKTRHERAQTDQDLFGSTVARYKKLIRAFPDHTFAIPFDQLKERGITLDILNTRNDYMASEQKLDPFASSPAKPPKCSLRGEWPDSDRMQLRVFRGLWGAKLLYDFWTDHKAVRWMSNTKLVVNETGLVISSPELEEIVEYKLKKDEEQYVWPEPFRSEVTAFKENRPLTRAKGDDRDERPRGKAKATPDKARVEKKERTPRPSKDGLISIGEIAKDMKIHPRIARGALRASKEPKPAAGWAWPKAEVERIKKIVTKGVKGK